MSDAPETQSPKGKGPRWIRVLLVLSLALNLAFVGVLGGAVYRAKERWGGKAPPPPSLSVTLFRAMDHETRRELLRGAAGKHQNFRAQREADRQALFDAMRKEPFDVTAVEQILEKQARQQAQFRNQVRKAWLEKLENMSDEDRERLLERFERDSNRSRFGFNPPPHR